MKRINKTASISRAGLAHNKIYRVFKKSCDLFASRLYLIFINIEILSDEISCEEKKRAYIRQRRDNQQQVFQRDVAL